MTSESTSRDLADLPRLMADYQRRALPWVIVLLLWIFVLMAALVFATDYFELPADPPGDLTGKRLAVIVVWGALTVGSVLTFCCFIPSPPKFPCPQCKSLLGREPHWKFAVATGYCPHCQHSLIPAEELNPVPEREPALLTRAEFQSRRPERNPLWELIPLVGFMAALMGGGVIARAMDDAAEQPGEYRFPIYLVGWSTCAGAAAIGLTWWQSRRRTRELQQCRCPRCEAVLAEGPLVPLTGRCTECGQAALADPPPRLVSLVSPAAMEPGWFRTHGGVWRRRAGWHCIIGSLPAAGFLAVLMWLCPLERNAPVTPFSFWFSLMMLTPLLQLGGIALARWWLRSRWSVCCPECRHNLGDVFPIVMSSCVCPFCATTIIAEPANDRSPTLLGNLGFAEDRR